MGNASPVALYRGTLLLPMGNQPRFCVFHGAAEVASLAHTPLGDMSHLDPDTLLDELVDYLIGGLRAPTGNRDYAPLKSNVSLQ